MCARFTISTPADLIAERFGLVDVPSLVPRYNVAPSQLVPVIGAKADGRRGLSFFKWGFIPHWAQEATGPKPVNAKAETVAQSVMFGDSFRKRRCLVPADGFYEWRAEGRKKLPVWFHLKDRAPFGFAGVWDVWPGPQGKVFTVAILTTVPNELTAAVHDRMPVILKREDEATWLNAADDDPARLLPLVGPYPADLMAADPASVSRPTFSCTVLPAAGKYTGRHDRVRPEPSARRREQMARGPLAGVILRMPLAALGGHAAGDAELLARFVAARDETAFELLVRRHGPMVLAVCLRVLRNRADAEDAFQATFLVLAHKAATVSPPDRLAGWLHGVAHKTALKARHRAARRAVAERLAPARSTEPMPPEPDWDEVEPLLDQELAALPERYRLPIVLCDLEGRRRTEVAATLCCAEGTLSARLTRGRRLLADRLRRRGVLLSAAALAGVLAGRSAALAEPLVRVTVPAALHAVSASGTAAAAASPSVAELATGVMKSMFLKKLQAIAVVALVAAAALTALAGLGADRSSAAPAAKAAPVPAAADDKATIEALADMEGQLLMNRKVLKDLKCDFDQFDKIMDAMEAAQKRAQDKTSEAMAQFRANPAAGRTPEGFRKMVAEAQEVGAKELNKAAPGVVADLTPAQRKRLREIDLQARGHEAFITPAVAKALDLNAKQKEQLAANAKQVEEDVAQANQRPAPVAVGRPGAPGGVATASFNSADSEKAVRDARAEGLKRAMAVLTDEQKTAWKKLTGEPFAYPLDRPARSGGGIGFAGGR